VTCAAPSNTQLDDLPSLTCSADEVLEGGAQTSEIVERCQCINARLYSPS